MSFIDDIHRLIGEFGEHPCTCGALMTQDEDGCWVCPNCGNIVEDDAYWYMIEDLEEEEGYYDGPLD